MSPDLLKSLLVPREGIPQEGIEQSKSIAIPTHPDGTDEGNTGTDGVRRRPIGAELNITDEPDGPSRREATLLTRLRTLLTQGQGGLF